MDFHYTLCCHFCREGRNTQFTMSLLGGNSHCVLAERRQLLIFPTVRKIGLRDKLRLKNISLQKWRWSNKHSFKESMVLENSNNDNRVLANSLKKTVIWTKVLFCWIPFSRGELVREFRFFYFSWTAMGVVCPLSQCSNWLKRCCQLSSCCWLNGKLYCAHKIKAWVKVKAVTVMAVLGTG